MSSLMPFKPGYGSRCGSVYVWLLALLVATACTPPVPSGEPNAAEPGTAAPGAAEPGLRVFTGARVIVGDGAVIENASFVVQGDIITNVGRAGEIEVPAGATVVDLTGRTVMPALVNTHAHLGWEKYDSWGSENFTRDTSSTT